MNNIEDMNNNFPLVVEGIASRVTKDVEYDTNSGCCGLSFIFLFFFLFSVGLIIVNITVDESYAAAYIPILLIPLSIALKGLTVIEPNEVGVLTFCGKYKGTIYRNGFHFRNPFYSCTHVSTKLVNFVTPVLKVNDKSGNPIMIGAIVTWRVSKPAKSLLDVEKLSDFINFQTESALRRVAYTFNYDKREENEICLKDGHIAVNNFLMEELTTHLNVAGIEIYSAEITNISYSNEIASVMLRRQQAEAIISARKTIIEGAVSICGMAINSLKANNIADLDNETRNKLVSNLLVVLCSENQVTPTLNTGA